MLPQSSMRLSLAIALSFGALALIAACGSDATSDPGTTPGSGGKQGTGGAALTGGAVGDAAVEQGAGGQLADGAVDPDSSTGGAASDATPGTGGTGMSYLVPPTLSCGSSGDACKLGAADPLVAATLRKDFFLPKAQYSEGGDIPSHGGRVQLAAVAAASGDVTGVEIDGVPVAQAQTDKKIEWYHVWPAKAVLGEPIWVAFHTRETKYDSEPTIKIVVKTASGDALNASVKMATTATPITYVTTTDDLSSVLIHVRNNDTAPRTLQRLILNGRDVTAAGVGCFAKTTLSPGETVLWSVPLCTPAKPGDAWTVVAEYQGGGHAVGAGRVIKPHFPIETWNNTSDCPFDYPGADADKHAAHVAAGFDTLFFHGGTGNGCAADKNSFAMFESYAKGTKPEQLLATTDLFFAPNPIVSQTDGLSGVFTGDEVDGKVYNGDTGYPEPAGNADETRTAWSRYPGLPTYVGAKTNLNIGSFAGVADIQGIDFYVAACAPHITTWGAHPPIRGAYDYLLNARNNHMPLPTWLYAQGLSPAWNKDNPVLGTIHVQPDPQEILVQAMSVPAAGAKGMMWFQTNQEEAQHKPARWQAIAKANWMIRGVRSHLRVGDLSGAATSSADVIVASIRAPRALVVPVVGIKTDSGPTDPNCAGGAIVSEQTTPHWKMSSTTQDIAVTIPEDFGAFEVFEVFDSGPADPATAPTVNGRVVTLPAVALDNATPVRLFVIAGDDKVRGEVAAATAH